MVNAIRELIESRDYQIIKSFHKIRVRYLEEQDIRAFDPDLKSFLNVNSPKELLEAQKLAFPSQGNGEDKKMK